MDSSPATTVDRRSPAGSTTVVASTSNKAVEDTVATPDLPRDSNSFPPVTMATPTSSSVQRPHRCEVCQRSFREVATLRKHEQLHRADRPYVCQTCGKSFLWSSNLKVHERVHTGERPYKCKICHRCFTQSNDLRRHERNVHMRGKIYGYKNTGGRQNSQVNLAAYQAFAMQQRALLQQALSYESYLQKSGQAAAAAQLFHHTQGLTGGTGGPRLMGPGRPAGEGSGTSPRSPLKLEQVTPPSTPCESETNGLDKHMAPGDGPLHSPVRPPGLTPMPLGHVGMMPSPTGILNSHYQSVVKTESFDLSHSRASGQHPSFNTFRPMQRSLENLQAISLAQRHLTGSGTGHGPPPHLSDQPNLPHHGSLRLSQDMLLHHQPHQSIYTLANNNAGENKGAGTLNGVIIANGPSSAHPPPGSPRLISPSQHSGGSSSTGDREREREMNERPDVVKMEDSESRSSEDECKRRERHSSMEYIRADPPHMERANSADYPYDHHHHHHRRHQQELQHSHLQLNHHSPHQHGPPPPPHHLDDLNHHPSRSAPPTSAIGSPDDTGSRHSQHHQPPFTPNNNNGLHPHNNNNNNSSGYPCDSVMDLSINKSSYSPPSRTSSNTSSSMEKELSSHQAMPPPKTPTSIGGGESESESVGKRDVTTTSATPTADSGGGIHHCHHCNIFFYDYTMFHLHESLHLPHEDDPFRCPSCGTHCQDKIEFMFHTVWHVKYPHTIPNYTPFREGIMSSP